MFPTGFPGAALFLLRVSVIGMLFGSRLQNSLAGNISSWKVLALSLISLMLFCGMFTPIASALSIILEALCWSVWDGPRSFEFSVQVLVMTALMLLGPGAYSIDSKIFGRRLILPPE